MKNCIFCKIIAKEIPNYTVYEDDHVLAFLDIHPRAKGHTLVIPKVHAENYFDLNEQLLGHLAFGVRRAMDKIEHALQPDGYNVGWNHGEAGGQEVPHLHVHIFPRYEGDGGGNMHSIVNVGGVDVKEIAALFA
jgi:histidine triad (HIT) family protein